MISPDFLLFQPALLCECTEARICSPMQTFQSLPHQNTVFISQIHYITDGCNRREFQKLVFLLLTVRNICLVVHVTDQLKCNSCSAETVKGIRIICAVRIDHRICRRKQIFHFSILRLPKWDGMMIRHNSFHSKFMSQTDLFCRGDPIITGNNQINAVLMSVPHKAFIQTISVPDTVRYSHRHIRSQYSETGDQNAGRHDPIDVIVSDNPDLLPVTNCVKDDSAASLHVLHA